MFIYVVLILFRSPKTDPHEMKDKCLNLISNKEDDVSLINPLIRCSQQPPIFVAVALVFVLIIRSLGQPMVPPYIYCGSFHRPVFVLSLKRFAYVIRYA